MYTVFSADLARYVEHRPSMLHLIMNPEVGYGEIGMGTLRAPSVRGTCGSAVGVTPISGGPRRGRCHGRIVAELTGSQLPLVDTDGITDMCAQVLVAAVRSASDIRINAAVELEAISRVAALPLEAAPREHSSNLKPVAGLEDGSRTAAWTT
jgi:hypothetical protein